MDKKNEILSLIDSIINEIDKLECLIYPNIRKDKITPLNLENDEEWLEIDPTLSEDDLSVLLLKLHVLYLFSGLYWELLVYSTNVENINWYNLVVNTYKIDLHHNEEINNVVKKLKTKSPENWVNLFK